MRSPLHPSQQWKGPRVQSPIACLLHRPLTAMSSLVAQFKEFRKSDQQQTQQVHRDVVKTMTLQDLEEEKILFGASKKGLTFKQAFEDASWTEFILSRFEKSEKTDHMMFIQYVKLRMEADTKIKTCKEMKATPMTKMAPPVPSVVWEELQTSETDTMIQAPLLQEEEMINLRQENQNLAHRMGQIEMVMQEVLEHLRKTNVKTEA